MTWSITPLCYDMIFPQQIRVYAAARLSLAAVFHWPNRVEFVGGPPWRIPICPSVPSLMCLINLM